MADHASHELFRLIHALTHGEWKTLLDDVSKSHSSAKGTNGEQVYVRLIKYLKEQSRYDDSEIKKHFGYDTAKPEKWRSLKRDTTNLVLKAVERTKSNQTKRVILQKSPTQIRALIEKELWKKADRVSQKFIALSDTLEQFGIQIQLLNLRQFIVTKSYPGRSVQGELDQLHRQRDTARERHNNLERYQDLWFRLTGYSKLKSNEKIRLIYSSQEITQPILLSNRATAIYFEILRRAAFALNDKNSYERAIVEGIQFCEGVISIFDELEIVDLFLKLSFEKAKNQVLERSFEAGNATIEKLIVFGKKKGLNQFQRTNVNERVFLLKILLFRASLEDDLLLQTIGEVDRWILEKRGYINEDTFLRLSLSGAISLFILADYPLAAKWITRIRSVEQSTFRPSISSAAWMIYMVIRIEQEEWEIISNQIASTEKYLKAYEPQNEFYWTLFHFFASVSNNSNITPIELSRLHTELGKLSAQPRYANLENYFDYSLWVEAKITNVSFQAQYKEKYELKKSSDS